MQPKQRTKTGGVFDCHYDSTFTLIRADASFFSFIGYTREEFAHRFQNHLALIIYEEEREHILEEVDRQVKKDGVFMYENRLVCKDGSLKWIWISAQLIQLNSGKQYFHCIFHDMEDEKKNEESLLISEKRLDYILSQTQDIIFEYDCLLNEVYYSENLEKKFGYTIPDKGFPDTLFSMNIIYKEDEHTVRNAFQTIRQGKENMRCEYRLKFRDKGYRWVRTQATALHDKGGQLIKILGVITDIHEQKQEILKSREQASLDPLTGLYNRRECLRRLENYIAINDDLFAFMLIDVDDFKLVNDTHGHGKGDEVLIGIASVLKSIIRTDDIAARIGGDEFVVCLLNLPNRHVAIDKADRIQDAFNENLHQALPCDVNCSIGICFYPDHGKDYQKLLEHADIAMYQAKKEGKNQYRIYDEDSTEQKYIVRPQKYMKKSFHDHIIENVMRILLETPEKEKALPLLLELTGQVFDCDRITVYKEHAETLQRYNEWVSAPVYRQESTELTIISQLYKRENPLRKPLAFVDITMIEDQAIRSWFLQRQTLAAIVCLIKDKTEKVTMVVCFEDCHALRNGSGEERYTLRMISEIIHLFLRNNTE